MRVTIRERVLELVQGDIAAQEADSIVNAANSALAGGGGVDGAIHRAGGPAIMEETRRRYPAGCPTGSAVISGAGHLRTKYVIHAVGPVWRGGNAGEPQLLASAYRVSLQLAAENDCRSVAMPALSAGAYGYPIEKAAQVALSTTIGFLEELAAESPLGLVRFVLFGADALAAFEQQLERLQSGKGSKR